MQGLNGGARPADRNQRKREILGFLSGQRGWVSSWEVAEAIGLTWANSANLLRNYSLYGLARRRRVVPEVGPAYHLYSLSARGRQRLAWLRGRGARVDRLQVIRPRVVRVIKPIIVKKKGGA